MTVMKVLDKKVWKCLQEIKVLGVGLLKSSTLTQLIVELGKVVDIDLKRPATLPQVIAEVLDIGQVLPATLPIIISEDMLI